MQLQDSIGFLRYEGKLVEDGVLDARAAARALNGFDSALRYFIGQDRPDIAATDFPIPVEIRKGSWEALIPTTIGQWIMTAAGIAGTAYLTAAASKMAEHDFGDTGLKDLFKKALKGVQWIMRIGKHLGHFDLKRVGGLKWENEDSVGLTNERGEVLYVPRNELKRISSCPSKLLSELASVIEFERTLVVGVNDSGRIETVEITRRERYIFFEEETNEILFPEFTHGLDVELDGMVTRGNEMSNTIGFLYDQHILTCIPDAGNIVRYKRHLFLACRIHGRISRLDKKGNLTEARPKIIFDNLTILSDREQLGFPFKGPDEE